MKSPKRLARTTGVIYLAVAVLAVFANFFARAAVLVPGDAAATARKLAENELLARMGFVADLVQAVLMLFVVMGFYLLLNHVNKNVARVMVTFVAVTVTIQCLNLLNYFAALVVATDPSYAAALGADGAPALVLLLIDMHQYGFLIAQIFFGLWLLPLGYLAVKSGMFPRPLGVVLIIACFCYLIDLLTIFLAPEIGAIISDAIVMPAAIGEVWMVFYLLIRGVKTSKQTEHVLVSA